jgi:uncharacterized coiled-coil protein SlyX
VELHKKIMDDDEKGKRFLELIDEQNNLQWSIISKLSSLIISKWGSIELQQQLETLVEKHSAITKELNSLDENNNIL